MWAVGMSSGVNAVVSGLLRTYGVRMPSYGAGALSPEEALVGRMRLTYDHRKFQFRDPDLPTELLPAGWVGHEAHEMFLDAHEILGPSAESYYDGGRLATVGR